MFTHRGSLLRVAHAGRFPNRSFGKDLQLILVYGAVILAFLEGRTPTIASIARYLQLPHETTKRYLNTVVALGLLTKDGRSYKPTERSRKGVAGADKIHNSVAPTGAEHPLGCDRPRVVLCDPNPNDVASSADYCSHRHRRRADAPFQANWCQTRPPQGRGGYLWLFSRFGGYLGYVEGLAHS
jgi:hypothetical protein